MLRVSECLDTLAFPAMRNREQNIQNPLKDTCAWLQNSAKYIHWLQRDHADSTRGLLWIKGKPGSGKSTLMKDAFLRIREMEGYSVTVAGFFFNARGGELERTPLGLLRSVIHQLCRQDSVAMSELMEVYQSQKESQLSSEQLTWSRQDLENLLKLIFRRQKVKRTIIFCDALDECEEDTVREIIYLFTEVCQSALSLGLDLNICLSSRHYPTISVDYCPEIVVERANQPDIATYVHARFGVIQKSEKDMVNKLVSEIIERSCGVFLWAVLVSDLLLQGLETGQPIDILQQRLSRVPSDMKDLYGTLCSSLKPEERDFSIRLFQWVLLADPMSVDDVVLAVLLSREWTWESLTSWGYSDDQPPPTERLKRYIKNASRGLIEYKPRNEGDDLDGQKQTSVQFIHETVREFFLTGRGLELVDSTLTDRPLAHSHLVLVKGAIEFIEHAKRWPSFKAVRSYCTQSIIQHARKAEEEGVSSIILLDKIEHSYAKKNGRRFYCSELTRLKNENTLSLLARSGLTSCVEACLKRGDSVDDAGMPFITPLIASVWNRRPPSEALILLLLSHGANVNANTEDGDTPLLVSLKMTHWKIAGLLLDHGADALATNYLKESPLHMLARRKLVDPEMKSNNNEWRKLMERLVEVSEILESKSITGSTPLHFASASSDADAVRLLLQKGVDVNVEDAKGTPLLKVVRRWDCEAYEIANLFIQHGANIQFKDRDLRTLLHHASCSSTVEMVKLLIDKGVEADAIDNFGQSALHTVAIRGSGYADIIKILVEAGCSVPAGDHDTRTAIGVVRFYKKAV